MRPEILTEIPAGLLDLPATALHQQLDGPTLIHLEGDIKQPLFVSVLAHGNEDAGWEAIRRLLKSRYEQDRLPRSLCLLIGNVNAARHRRRRLDDQPDFNRCWPGGENIDPDYGAMFQGIFDAVAAMKPLACIDIHNNTGLNPHYAAINRIDASILWLAGQFSRTVVYFTIPSGTQANAFADICPALTLECGQAGVVSGVDHAMTFIEQCLRLDHIPAPAIEQQQVKLFHMLATVYVPAGLDFVMHPKSPDQQNPLSIQAGLDALNFTELPADTLIGTTFGKATAPLLAIDNQGSDISKNCFSFENNQIRTIRPLMPSMLTPDLAVIRQDCLCYLMERIDLREYAVPASEGIAPSELPEQHLE